MLAGGCLGHHDSPSRVWARVVMDRASSAGVQGQQVVYDHLHLGAAADEASVLGWRGGRGGFEGRVATWVFGR